MLYLWPPAPSECGRNGAQEDRAMNTRKIHCCAEPPRSSCLFLPVICAWRTSYPSGTILCSLLHLRWLLEQNKKWVLQMSITNIWTLVPFSPVLFSLIFLQSFFRLGNFLQLFVPFLLFFWQLLIIFGSSWHLWGTFVVFPFLTALLSESFMIRIINNKQYIKDHFIALTSITTDRYLARSNKYWEK